MGKFEVSGVAMDIIVTIILVAGALLAIASGIWVAFALGGAISIHRKKKVPSESESESGSK